MNDKLFDIPFNESQSNGAQKIKTLISQPLFMQTWFGSLQDQRALSTIIRSLPLAMHPSQRPLSSCLLFLAALLSSPGAVGDNVYRSIGPDGRVVYSDQPPVTGTVQKIYSSENLPASPVPEATQRYRRELQSSMNRRLANQAIPAGDTRLFAASWCGYCRKAKAYLGQKGISYREIDIDTAEGEASFAQVGGSDGIPLLLHNGQRVRGFTPAAYDALFGRGK